MKKTLLITTILGGLLSASNSYAQTCTAAPSCADLGYGIQNAADCTSRKLKFLACPFDKTKGVCTTAANDCTSLGYTDTKDLCPGDYSICPHDTTKVKCILDAAVGDLKFSWQTKNHDGWLLCNGASISAGQFSDLVSILGTTTLPNYNNYFLKGAATSGTTTFKTRQAAGLPNITGEYTENIGEFSTSIASDSALFVINSVAHNAWAGSTPVNRKNTLKFDASRSSSIYGKSTTVTPQNYSANVFIYAGKKSKSNSDLCERGDYISEIGVCSDNGSTAEGIVISRTNLSTSVSISYVTFRGGTSYTSRSTAVSNCANVGGYLASLSQLQSLFSAPNAEERLSGWYYDLTSNYYWYSDTSSYAVKFASYSTSYSRISAPSSAYYFCVVTQNQQTY